MKPYYERDGVTIYHGDSLEVLASLPEAHAAYCVTDPPYTAAGGSTNGRENSYDTQFFDFWWRSVADALRRVVTPSGCAFVFCDWRTLHLIGKGFQAGGSRTRGGTVWEMTQALVWDRAGIGMGSPFRNSYEMIALARGPGWKGEHIPKNIPTVVRFPWSYGSKDHHGAQKPVGLVDRLLGWASPDDGALCVDPFMGSGTTLLAARQMGRRAIGIDIDERCCEDAVNRLRQQVLLTAEAPIVAPPEPEPVGLFGSE